MNKQELINELAGRLGISKRDAGLALESLAEIATNELKSSEEFVLPGLGKLSLKARAARTGRNPRTGEAVEIPAALAVKFTPAKALKDAVNP